MVTLGLAGAVEPSNSITPPGIVTWLAALRAIWGGTVANRPGDTIAACAGSPRNTARRPAFVASGTCALQVPSGVVVVVASVVAPRVVLRRSISTVAPPIGPCAFDSTPPSVTLPG